MPRTLPCWEVEAWTAPSIALVARQFSKPAKPSSPAREGCQAGRAVATPGGRLAAKYVIHTVGPIWSGGQQREAETLASCHQESIRVADELQLQTVAFPAISTGVYGYPLDQAAEIAVASAARALVQATHVREVKFVLYDTTALQYFCTVAKVYAGSKSLRMDSCHVT